MSISASGDSRHSDSHRRSYIGDGHPISFGTKYCNGTSGAFRLDNAQARTFLQNNGVPLN